MSGQEKNASQKRRGRPATGRGQTIGVRVHDDLLEKLDQSIVKYNQNITRPEALRKYASIMLMLMQHANNIDDLRRIIREKFPEYDFEKSQDDSQDNSK